MYEGGGGSACIQLGAENVFRGRSVCRYCTYISAFSPRDGRALLVCSFEYGVASYWLGCFAARLVVQEVINDTEMLCNATEIKMKTSNLPYIINAIQKVSLIFASRVNYLTMLGYTSLTMLACKPVMWIDLRNPPTVAVQDQ